MDAREGGSLSNAELLDELNVSEREGEGGTERKNTGEYVLETGGLSLRTSFRLRLVHASLASRGGASVGGHRRRCPCGGAGEQSKVGRKRNGRRVAL